MESQGSLLSDSARATAFGGLWDESVDSAGPIVVENRRGIAGEAGLIASSAVMVSLVGGPKNPRAFRPEGFFISERFAGAVCDLANLLLLALGAPAFMTPCTTQMCHVLRQLITDN